MLTEVADVNSIYEESLANLRDRVPIDNGKGKGLPSIAEREQAAKDYYANVRTNVLLTWALSNVSHIRRAFEGIFLRNVCRACCLLLS